MRDGVSRVNPAEGQEPLVVEADRAFVLPDQSPVRDVVLVNGDAIVERISDSPTRLRFPGCSIVPGLIDCHVHLGLEGNADEPLNRKEIDPILMTRLARNARIALKAGVTTCRDLGTRNRLAIFLDEAWRRGLIDGPRIFASGRPLGAPEGHCNYMTVDVRNADEAREAVASEVGAGARAIKLMVTGGIVPPSRGTQLSPESVSAAVEEAHARHVSVAAHSETPEGARVCADAGVDSIEHGAHIPDDVLIEMAAKGISFVPTMTAFHLIVVGDDHGLPQETVRKAAEILEQVADTVRRARLRGVQIATGTDWKHGLVGLEARLLVQAGLTTKEALVAATQTGARLLRISDRAGHLLPGAWADLVVVDGDPSVDIGALSRVRAVIARGRLVYQS